MSLKHKTVNGVIWSIAEGWGRQAISLLVFLLLARLLGPEAFGLIALASVFTAFVGVFLEQGFSEAIIQRQDLEPEHLDTAFWVNLGISTLIATLSIACAGWTAELFKEPALAPILRWLSLNFILGALSNVQTGIFQRRFEFKLLAIRSLIAVVVGGVVGITMAFLGFGVWSLVGQQLSNSVARVLTTWWACDWKPGLRVSKKHFKDLFSFGINIMGFNFVNFFNRRADDFLIGYFLGSVALGYYSIAYKLLLVMLELLTRVIEKVAMPSFSKLQQEPERIRNAFYTVTQYTSLISFPVFMGVGVLAPELIPILFGKQWQPSVPVMQILSFIGIVQSISPFNSTVILAMGKPSWRLVLGCISCIVNIVSFSIAVRWGIVAVASAYIIGEYILSPLPIFLIRKLIHIEIPKYYRQYLAPISASLAMAVAMFGLKSMLKDFPNVYLILTACILLGILVYALTLSLISPKLFQEIVKIRKFALPKAK